MDTPKTINLEKYIEALDNLCGCDHAYFTNNSDVDTIVEAIVTVKKLEDKVKKLAEENERLNKLLKCCRDDEEYLKEKYNNVVNNTVNKMQTMIQEKCIGGGIWPAFVAKVIKDVGDKLLEEQL